MNMYAIRKPGRLNSVSVGMLVILALLGYAGWFLVPVYWPYFQLAGMMRGTCSDAYRSTDDDALMARLVRDSARTGLRLGPQDFVFERIRYTPEELRALLGDRADTARTVTQRGKECVIRFRHEADHVMPLLGKTVRLSFSTEKRVSLAPVSWDR
jgi:hypothetical protein